MYNPTLLHLLALYSFNHLCFSLPINQSLVTERSAIPQQLPGAGQTEAQAQASIQSQQNTQVSGWPKEKRDESRADMEKEYPLTNAMLKMIRNALPITEDALQKRDNSSIDGIPSAASVFSALPPETQSMLKDTMRYGIALVMKEGAWALSP